MTKIKSIVLGMFLFLLIAGMTNQAHGLSLVPEELPDFPADRVWINSKPLTKNDLKGKVVLFDFWTYSCINCLRTIPHLQDWYRHYQKMGFVIIGIHAPEFAFERDEKNVREAVKRLGVTWPVILDNDNSLWNTFHNRYWPAEYLYGADGKFIHQHFGEGDYDETEGIIQKALTKIGHKMGSVVKKANGEEVNFGDIGTPEIYFGYERLRQLQNANVKKDAAGEYSSPARLLPNHFALAGAWKIDPEKALSLRKGNKIFLHYRARRVNIVASSKKPVHFSLKLDGKPVPAAWGADDSKTAILEARLYRLINTGKSGSHILEISFDDLDVEVFTFTFG